MGKNCNRCQAEITWRTPYVKGDKPLNPDMTPHICSKAVVNTIQPSNPIQQLFENPNWDIISEEEITEDMRELMVGLKTMRSLAWMDTKKVHPDMDERSNTFGQIVNAGISHLINLAKVKALRVKK